VISRLDAVRGVVDVKHLAESLLPAITELAAEKKWRVQAAILDFMPLLARQLGRRVFEDNLSTICVQALEDNVAAIRARAAANLSQLAAVLGPEWAVGSVVPRLDAQVKKGSYLLRLTGLRALALLGRALPEE